LRYRQEDTRRAAEHTGEKEELVERGGSGKEEHSGTDGRGGKLRPFRIIAEKENLPKETATGGGSKAILKLAMDLKSIAGHAESSQNQMRTRARPKRTARSKGCREDNAQWALKLRKQLPLTQPFRDFFCKGKRREIGRRKKKTSDAKEAAERSEEKAVTRGEKTTGHEREGKITKKVGNRVRGCLAKKKKEGSREKLSIDKRLTRTEGEVEGEEGLCGKIPI